MFDFSGSMFTISCALASPKWFYVGTGRFSLFVCSQTFALDLKSLALKRLFLTQNSSATSASLPANFLYM